MLVSVIVTTESWTRYGDYIAAIRSVENQTHDAIELVCPIDHTEAMAAATEAITDGGTVSYVETDCMAAARNRGAELATGDVYAFLDDDCIASQNWVADLASAYDAGALAAGGPALPIWPSGGRPWWLPQPFDWLVGCGPYHPTEQKVRNTYGCNLSIRADVFDELGGFDESLGKGTALDQGEEAELCGRLRERYAEQVRYQPDAIVRHRVYPNQVQLVELLRRAYRQGRAKSAIGVGDEERGFLEEVLYLLPTRYGPAAAAYTTATGLGYLSGVVGQ